MPTPMPDHDEYGPLASSFRGRRATAALLPNLITTGNAVCGFLAIYTVTMNGPLAGQPVPLDSFKHAAWFIILGMLFDVFDGRVARLMGRTSDLGAQLDSLCDLVTFGVAPAFLMISLHRAPFLEQLALEPLFLGKTVWMFGLAYFLGGLLRLARFNVEHDPSEQAHQCFKGLPTPAAAGAVASLVLVYCWLSEWQAWELVSLSEMPPEWVVWLTNVIPNALPFATFGLGCAMVSTGFSYPHVASQLLARRDFSWLVYAVFGGIITAVMLEPTLCVLFVSYMLCAPVGALLRKLRRTPARAVPQVPPVHGPPQDSSGGGNSGD